MAASVIVGDSFLGSALELPKEVSRKVFKALHLFVRDRTHPGLHVEKLAGAKDAWSLRVDQDYRVIFSERDGTPVLLFVGKHDTAYRKAGVYANMSRTTPALHQGRWAEAPLMEGVLEAISGTSQSPPVEFEEIQTLIRTRKYTGIARHLIRNESDSTTLSFADVERLIGASLPDSARRHRAWWGNDRKSHSQASGWLGVGWQVKSAHLPEERVVFQRMASRVAQSRSGAAGV